MVMFDSLNRRMLSPYGGDWIPTPNFQRLADRCVTFDQSYVCSMPCMPARRDLHTARPGFLHRGWGPLEPFDDSVPGRLREHGIHTHLATDHYHYFESGGAGYHSQYSTWELFRGQEGDPWKPNLRDDFEIPENLQRRPPARLRQDLVNRGRMTEEADHHQSQTFAAGLAFLDQHAAVDNWFLQIELFDPHEPFFSPQRFKDLFPHDYTGPLCDWPVYGNVDETKSRDLVDHLRAEYAALVAMCDENLGKVLDRMDDYGMWEDTLLIVNTDHGFLLGEHDHLGKAVMPLYQEIAHTPLFLWDPRLNRSGERSDALVQAIDWGLTLLDAFDVQPTLDMMGISLSAAAAGKARREAALFGFHGHYVNVTDGRYVYMRAARAPENAPLFTYTLSPCEMSRPYPAGRLAAGVPAGPLSYSKGADVMRYPEPSLAGELMQRFGTLLFDVEADPEETTPLHDAAVESRMIGHMVRLMKEADAPPEQYVRLGLTPPSDS